MAGSGAWLVSTKRRMSLVRGTEKEPAFIESYWLSVERRCGYVPAVWHAASQTEHTNTKYADFDFYAKSAKSVFACSRVRVFSTNMYMKGDPTGSFASSSVESSFILSPRTLEPGTQLYFWR